MAEEQLNCSRNLIKKEKLNFIEKNGHAIQVAVTMATFVVNRNISLEPRKAFPANIEYIKNAHNHTSR